MLSRLFIITIIIFSGIGFGFAYSELSSEIIIEQLSPHKQIFYGVLPHDVICKSEMELIFKTTDGSTACVKPETLKKLVERGWGSTLPFNTVLIMIDDLSVTMLDVLLENNMMPNLQEHIINQSTTFENSFVSGPLCCPSRATSLTGQFPHNHGVISNVPSRDADNKIVIDGSFYALDDSSTIATWLQNAGYRTGFIGKYLNQYDPFIETINTKFFIPKLPVEKTVLGEIGYVPPGWDSWQAFTRPTTNSMYNFTINNNGIKEVNISDYKTDYVSDSAVDFINESNSGFFLYVSTTVAHGKGSVSPCKLSDEGKEINSNLVLPKYKNTLDSIPIPYHPSFNEKDISDKPPRISVIPLIENLECLEKTFKQTAETVRSVDDLIGNIYNALEENNQLNNTVIIFTSDNGFMFGEHRYYGKVYPYEESIRVPLYITFPGLGMQTVEHLVINNDLVSTIVEFTGIKPDISVDGFSLLPIMKDSSKKLRDGFLIELRSERMFYQAIRGINYLYVEYGGANDGFREFYDLNEDPFQQSNLIGCSDEKCIKNIEKFDEWLDEFKKCGDGTCQRTQFTNFNGQS